MPPRCWPRPSSPHSRSASRAAATPPARVAQSRSPTAGCRSFRSPRNAARSRCRRTATSPDGRKITLSVAVLPANTLHPRADPLFILAGGPGQAASFLGPFAAALTGVRKDRDIVLVDQRGTGRSSPLVCAAFKPDHSLEGGARVRSGAEGRRLRARARRAGRGRRAIHDGRVGRRPRCGARGARLRQDQPLGRLVRNARGAGIPAPAPGARAQRRARRRRIAVDEDHARRLAVARSRPRRRCSKRARASPACAARASRPRAHARRDSRPARAAGARRRADRSAHRRNAVDAHDVRSRDRRAAAVHLRAGARGASAGSHRPRRRRRFRSALRRRDARDRRSRRAVEHGAPLLGHLRGGRAARIGRRGRRQARHAAHEGARRTRARRLRGLAEGRGRSPTRRRRSRATCRC